MSTATADSESERLDREIDDLRAQVTSLQKELGIQCSTILSSAPAQAVFAKPSSPSLFVQDFNPESLAHAKLASRAASQQAYMQQCAYRSSTPVTAFKVHDPDPNAVNDGHVLGLRFEIMSRGQFLRPYYVMLNRPFPDAPRHLRVHRHTVPPAIPLSGLAARHLPPPSPSPLALPDDSPQDATPEQSLDGFVRAVRREIVRYHNRLGVAADLRRCLGLHGGSTASEGLSANSVIEIGIADIEAKQIKLTWADGRTGRLTMDGDGNVLKLAIFRPQGRDWQTARELFGPFDKIEDVARKIEQRHNADASEQPEQLSPS